MPPPTLKPEDWNNRNPGQRYRPQLGFQPHSGYRNNTDMSSAHRMIMSSAGIHGQGLMPTPMKAGLMGAGPGLMGAAPRGSNMGGANRPSYSQACPQQCDLKLQDLHQARALVASLKPAIEGFLRVSGWIHTCVTQVLCYR
ncbi:hypothetical protein PoB_007700800 [Plakobranchus ocellatus]|uniref:Uncharacterized protein n=1 Tax=Plakobranchus ocellatus TaxID=259542 RepID=A0AAV4E1J9_9GAST|nr:hypothetical protein PoB_007700800 [Plakobranchus ocellatus]